MRGQPSAKLQLLVSALPGTGETLDGGRGSCLTSAQCVCRQDSILQQAGALQEALREALCGRKEQEIPAGVEKMFRSLSKTLTFS